MYHRVADVRSDPWGLCVTPTHFEEHLEVLSRTDLVFSLREFTRRAAGGALRRDAIVITFDDGYADNLHAAAPLLERYDLPATFFIVTADTHREFWWDELDRLLVDPVSLPDEVRLVVDGDELEWSPGCKNVSGDASSDRTPHWSAWDEPPTRRHAMYVDLWHRLYQLPDADKWNVLKELASQVAVKPEVRASHRLLSEREIAKLGQSPLFEIGAHTVTHPALPTLDEGRQLEEIQQSKSRLENILGRSVDGFSYPHGAYTPETVSLVQACDFTYACAADGGPLRGSASLLTLPRLMVPNVPGAEFAGWLNSVMTPVPA